ncbi:conserved hypothetical protein [Yersinia pestis KIM D27]|nr:hypothetical protein YpAngola_A4159 [Yersinia pestis Angola]EDR43890.1 hypothetical protein YpE1979001_3740 [Yersinia pestis biovar Antiqua str. E1979001]EFA47583.1 conserved hypothetical protein [Yersinia pestis KIM D27]
MFPSLLYPYLLMLLRCLRLSPLVYCPSATPINAGIDKITAR